MIDRCSRGTYVCCKCELVFELMVCVYGCHESAEQYPSVIVSLSSDPRIYGRGTTFEVFLSALAYKILHFHLFSVVVT